MGICICLFRCTYVRDCGTHLMYIHTCIQEVLHTISSPYGVVQRIAIFRKNGVQALVEFDSNASAARAKANLEGADIYAGCCTLKTEYARVCV